MKIIVRGKAKGKILISKSPINFLGGVDKRTGIVRDENHDLFGRSLGGKILAFPYGIGSSVGAYTIYSLKYNKSGPLAMICLKTDLTTASGCAICDIPLVVLDEKEYGTLRDGKEWSLDATIGTLS